MSVCILLITESSLKDIEKKKEPRKMPLGKKGCRIVISRNGASDMRFINHDNPLQSSPKNKPETR